MNDVFTRFFEDLVGRLSGPLHFRLILQPIMAVLFAIRDGRRDAREGRAAYFWALFSDPEHRRDLLRSGLKSVGKIIVLALILDAAYQLWVFRWFYPNEAILVTLILAIVPYVLLRGLVNRLASTVRKESCQ